MPKRGPAGSVAESALVAWLRSHPDSHGAEVARARLQYQELEGQGRFLRGLLGRTRIRPRVLITAQVSGRWSTTDPNLPGRPRDIKEKADTARDVIVPDWGTWWLKFDYRAVEGLLAAEYAQEDRDLIPLKNGEDIHLATLKDMFPGEEIAKDDPRRHMAKTTRYNLQYAFDYRGILEAPDLGLFGGRDGALQFAQRYIESRPALARAKQVVFSESIRTGIARSGFGRLRRLTGDAKTKSKDGWSQTIQGTVSGMMNRVLVQILDTWDDARLVLNEHDGATLAFPAAMPRTETLAAARRIIEQPWTLWGRRITCPAEIYAVECPDNGHDAEAGADAAGGAGNR